MPATDYVFVVNEKTIDISVKDKNGYDQFIEKASFSMNLLKHIDSGDESGFLCSVNCSLRDEERWVLNCPVCHSPTVLGCLLFIPIRTPPLGFAKFAYPRFVIICFVILAVLLIVVLMFMSVLKENAGFPLSELKVNYSKTFIMQCYDPYFGIAFRWVGLFLLLKFGTW